MSECICPVWGIHTLCPSWRDHMIERGLPILPRTSGEALMALAVSGRPLTENQKVALEETFRQVRHE